MLFDAKKEILDENLPDQEKLKKLKNNGISAFIF